MLDDNELESRLHAAAQRVVSAPIAPPRRVADLEPTARSRGDRRTLRVVAITTSIAVVATTFALIARRDLRPATKVEVTPSTKPTYEVDKDGLPLELPGISKEQMRAHLGVGVPRGWEPVDFGEARLWTPGTPVRPVGENPTAAPKVPAREGCRDAMHGGRDQRLVEVSCSFSLNGTGAVLTMRKARSEQIEVAEARIANGFELKLIKDLPMQKFWVATDQGVEIELIGVNGEALLATLAPSARRVVEAVGIAETPDSWRKVSVGRARFSVPPDWSVDGSGSWCTPMDKSVSLDPDPSGCPSLPMDPRVASVVTRRNLDSHGTVVNEWFASTAIGNQTLQIFLGRDGRVGRAILQSAHSGSDSGAEVEGCPRAPTVNKRQFATSAQHLVPDDLVEAVSCTYGTVSGLVSAEPIQEGHEGISRLGALQRELLASSDAATSCVVLRATTNEETVSTYLVVRSSRWGEISLRFLDCGTLTNGDRTESHAVHRFFAAP